MLSLWSHREKVWDLQDTPPVCEVLPCPTSQPFLDGDYDDDDNDDDDEEDEEDDDAEEAPRRLKRDEQRCKRETKQDRLLMPSSVIMINILTLTSYFSKSS